MDNTFLTLYQVAKAYHADGDEASEAARQALREAHSSLSQSAFCTLMDAHGGSQHLVATLTRALRGEERTKA